jgi:hypothetical protein
VSPPVSDNPDETVYEEWDCPQVMATHPYVACQPDELSLEVADVVNVLRKTSDGKIWKPFICRFLDGYINESNVDVKHFSVFVKLCDKTNKCTCTKCVLSHIIKYLHISTSVVITIRVALQQYCKYSKLINCISGTTDHFHIECNL